MMSLSAKTPPLQPYLETKISDVAWFEEIPNHWDFRRFKYLIKECDQRSVDGNEQLLRVSQYTGVTERKQIDGRDEPDTRAKSLIGYKCVRQGDLVINIMLAWNGSMGISRYTGIASPAYCVYKFQNNVDPWFFHYLLRTPIYKSRIKTLSTGVIESRLRLYSENLFRLEGLLPPFDEQLAIVRYLDFMDRRIQRFIRAKQKLIKLLNEQKQAIIRQAVTRGLDPNVRFKPSGEEWFGDVPEHWEIKRIKQTTRIIRGKFTHRPRNDPSFYDGQYPFIQTGEVARANKRVTHYKQTLNSKGFAVSKMFPAGTLLMTIAANIGDVAILDFEACFPDSIVGFIPVKEVIRDFLYYLFYAMKQEFLHEAPVNTQGNLNVGRIGARKIVIPPLCEQQHIISFIEKETKYLDITINHTNNEIILLQEYNTRLIADVVTGKLDVRDASAKLPDELEELEPVEEELSEEETLEELELELEEGEI